ncbi:MAG: Transcriptional regulator, MarR family [Chloroflexi bacterium]|jgi:AcrR family transcriptional regulator|nr:Transcriptional regulator, MarR family [Chloroflexota bacterium]
MTEQSSQRTRPALDRGQVARAALQLLDEVGLDDLTMRRLADRMGVTAASLYWHVRDKNELLAMLGEEISAEIPLPRQDLPWREALTQAAREYRRAMLAHRDGARVLVATPPIGAQRMRGAEAFLAMLRNAGFSMQDVADIGYVCNSFIVGYVLDETLSTPEPQPDAKASEPTGAALLGNLSSGQLLVRQGGMNLTVRSDASITDLYRLDSEGRPPEIQAREGTITFKQRHGRRESSTLTLNGAIPWEIEIQGGAHRVNVELPQGKLASLAISGGVSDCRLQLPAPVGPVPIRIDGGVSKLRFERPAGAALRVLLVRGSSKLTLDTMHFGAVGGDMKWESPGFADALGNYDLQVRGGNSELIITTSSDGSGRDERQEGVAPGANAQQVFGPRPEEHPTLAALAEHLASPDTDRRFEVGLQIFLDGLERRLARSREVG